MTKELIVEYYDKNYKKPRGEPLETYEVNIIKSLGEDERFVSRYIAKAIYCIIWKYRDIAIFRKYRDILTIFSVSDNGQF